MYYSKHCILTSYSLLVDSFFFVHFKLFDLNLNNLQSQTIVYLHYYEANFLKLIKQTLHVRNNTLKQHRVHQYFQLER